MGACKAISSYSTVPTTEKDVDIFFSHLLHLNGSDEEIRNTRRFAQHLIKTKSEVEESDCPLEPPARNSKKTKLKAKRQRTKSEVEESDCPLEPPAKKARKTKIMAKRQSS